MSDKHYVVHSRLPTYIPQSSEFNCCSIIVFMTFASTLYLVKVSNTDFLHPNLVDFAYLFPEVKVCVDTILFRLIISGFRMIIPPVLVPPIKSKYSQGLAAVFYFIHYIAQNQKCGQPSNASTIEWKDSRYVFHINCHEYAPMQGQYRWTRYHLWLNGCADELPTPISIFGTLMTFYRRDTFVSKLWDMSLHILPHQSSTEYQSI